MIKSYNKDVKDKTSYFPTKALTLKKTDLQKLKENDDDYYKAVVKACKSLDKLSAEKYKLRNKKTKEEIKEEDSE